MSAKITLMTLGEGRFALPAEATLHIMQVPEIFRLPLVHRDFGGVFFYNGALVPLFRLDRFLVPEKHDFPWDLCYTVICVTGFGPVGLPVERVVKIVDQDRGRFTSHAPENGTTFCTTEFVYDALPYPLLEMDTLLAERYS